MERARKSTYWLILPVLMIIAGVLSLVAAPTQSRYTTVTGWQMTLSQVEEGLYCDLLTEQGQKIRLQDMTVGEIRQIDLYLTAVGDAENVTVSVESKYLTVDMELTGSIYNGETLKRTLTLAANEGAMQTVTTPTEASAKLTLTWDGGTLQGEFLVLLLPAEITADGSVEPDDATENAGTTTDGTTVPSEPSSPQEGDWLSAMANFAADGTLPLLINVPEGCDRLQIELGVDDTAVGAFPAGTRYSTDGGASDTLLYDPYVIQVTPEEGQQQVSVLVDLAEVELSSENVLTVTVSALQGEDVFAVSTVRTLAELNLPSIQWDSDPLVLTEDRSLQCIMPVYGDSETVTVIPFNEEQTEALPSVKVEEGLLTISADAGAAKPGTYKAVLMWSWSGLEVARQEFNFYVNYTPYVNNR